MCVADDYGLGQRSGLEEAVEAVIATLGMAPCEGTDVVPPNARFSFSEHHAGPCLAFGS